MKKAIWVGGPPGKTMDRIRKQLLEQAQIEIIRHVGADPKFRSNQPISTSGADLILMNVDMLDHGLQENARNAAATAGIPWCFAKTSTVMTIKNLEAKNLLPPPVSTEGEPVVDEEEPDGTGWFLHEDEGALHIRMPRGDGRVRRTKPIIVGENVFVSSIDAAKGLGVHQQEIAQALADGHLVNDQIVGLPHINDIVIAFPHIEVDPALLDTNIVIDDLPEVETRPIVENEKENREKRALRKILALLQNTDKPPEVKIEASVMLIEVLLDD